MSAVFASNPVSARPGQPWRSWSGVQGHASPVTCLAWSARKQLVVSGGYDGYVMCWDRELGAGPRWSARFPDLVNAVSIDCDSRQLAVAVADSYAYIVDLDTGRICEQLGPHGDDVNDIRWDPADPTRLALVCEMADPHVYLWHLGRGGPASQVIGDHPEGAFALSFADTGRRVVTASDDGGVRIWDLASGGLEALFPHPAAVETVAFGPGGDVVATGCLDGTLRVWTCGPDGWAPEWESADTKVSVRNCGFSPSGQRIFAGSYDGHLRLYDRESHTLVAQWSGPLQWERAAVMEDEDTVLVGSFGDRPLRRHVQPAEPVAAGDGLDCRPTWGVNVLGAGRDGSVFVGSDCGHVGALGSAEPLVDVRTLVTGIAVADDGASVAVTDYLGRLLVLDRAGPPLATATTDGGPLNAVLWAHDGTLLTGGYDGVIRRWSAGAEELDPTPAHGGQVKALAQLADGGLLVSVSADSTAAAWLIGERLQPVARLQSDGIVLINAVAAPRRGRSWVALGSRDRHIRLWDPQVGIVAELPAVHTKSVKAVAVSPEGDLIVSGGYDGLVVFWHLDPEDQLVGRQTHVLHGKPGVSSVVITDDSVITAGWDGSVGRWTHDGALVDQYTPT